MTVGVPVELDQPDAPVEVELGFARAHLRIDRAALGALVASDLGAVGVEPRVTATDGRDPAAVARALGPNGGGIVTLPGDEFRFVFHVPNEKGTQAFFLESRGYYHEWMRTEWLAEEDVPRAERYLADPHAAYRELAAAYKLVEPNMEAIFQASRFSGRLPR